MPIVEKMQGQNVRIRLKIYGERNSGTKYLGALIAQNLDVEQLPGVIPLTFNVSVLPRIVGQAMEKMTELRVMERYRDRYFRQNFQKTLGWKHTVVPVDRLHASVGSDTVFVAITKNPYAWLLSMRRHPYHAGRRFASMREFMESEWKTVGRENAAKTVTSPVDLWQTKAQSYLDLRDKIGRTEIIRYEELLDDPEAVIERLATTFGVKRRGKFTNVVKSTENSDRDFDDYRCFYLNRHWLSYLTPDDVRLANSLLDRKLLKLMGYTILQPEAAVRDP